MSRPRALRRPRPFRHILAGAMGYGHRPPATASSLHAWVVAGDVEKLKDLLAEGVNVDAVDATGCTPLHVALLLDDVPCVRLLLQWGARASACVEGPSVGAASWLRCRKGSLDLGFAQGDCASILVRSQGALACLLEADPLSLSSQMLWEALMRRPDSCSRRLPLLEALMGQGVNLQTGLDELVVHQKCWMHLGQEATLLVQARALLRWGARPSAHTLALAVATQGQDALDLEERSLALFKMLMEEGGVEVWSMAEDRTSAEALLREKFLMPDQAGPWLEAYQQGRQAWLSAAWPTITAEPDLVRL